MNKHEQPSETPIDFTSEIKQKGLLMFLELTIAACHEITGELEATNKNDPQIQKWDKASDLLTKVQVAIGKIDPAYATK